MEGYLGSFPVNIADSKFKDYTPTDWVMYFVARYGQIDGGHHKAWVIDQTAQLLKGTPVIVEQAKWSNGLTEYRVYLGEPSEEYLNWVQAMLGECNEDGEYDYDYDDGIAP